MKKNRILVVEDDNDARNALCAMLEGLGHEPVSFESALPVMEAIIGTHLDLAMLDVMMPEMNGYELLQLIRASDEFASLPVFMVTARDNDDEVLKGYEFGADYYIMKPYTTKQIDYGIKLFLEGKGSK
jgi:DNA-binding response OmpR family regulator